MILAMTGSLSVISILVWIIILSAKPWITNKVNFILRCFPSLVYDLPQDEFTWLDAKRKFEGLRKRRDTDFKVVWSFMQHFKYYIPFKIFSTLFRTSLGICERLCKFFLPIRWRGQLYLIDQCKYTIVITKLGNHVVDQITKVNFGQNVF